MHGVIGRTSPDLCRERHLARTCRVCYWMLLQSSMVKWLPPAFSVSNFFFSASHREASCPGDGRGFQKGYKNCIKTLVMQESERRGNNILAMSYVAIPMILLGRTFINYTPL